MSDQPDWIWRWQRIAKRVRVPLGFVAAALYLFDLWLAAPHPEAVAASRRLVRPGVWLRAYAAGYVKKNRELTVTGPYAYTRNPLYLGSMLIAFGFALALLSWMLALVLALLFVLIYAPVIAGEERFLRGAFAEYDEYSRQTPRLLPRLTAAPMTRDKGRDGGFSFSLYCKHREYNAGIGTALLYVCLLLLRPAIALVFHSLR